MQIYVEKGIFFAGKVKDLQPWLQCLSVQQVTLAQFIKEKTLMSKS